MKIIPETVVRAKCDIYVIINSLKNKDIYRCKSLYVVGGCSAVYNGWNEIKINIKVIEEIWYDEIRREKTSYVKKWNLNQMVMIKHI